MLLVVLNTFLHVQHTQMQHGGGVNAKRLKGPKKNLASDVQQGSILDQTALPKHCDSFV